MSGRHDKYERRTIRHLRIRKRIRGTDNRPRLSVFRSSNHIYAQLVDDVRGVTMVSASSRDDLQPPADGKVKGKVGISVAVGKLLAERAKAKGLSSVCFDRSGYLFHGRVKALADGARAGGLEF